jgi:hypothetical protein
MRGVELVLCVAGVDFRRGRRRLGRANVVRERGCIAGVVSGLPGIAELLTGQRAGKLGIAASDRRGATRYDAIFAVRRCLDNAPVRKLILLSH